MTVKPVRLIFLTLFALFLFRGNASGQFYLNTKRTISETGHQLYGAAYSNDGSFIVSAGSDNNIIIWNADKGTIHRTLAGLKKRPNTADLNIENQIVVSGGEDNIISVWDIASATVSNTLSGHKGAIKSVTVSNDGRLLASGSSDKTVRLWDMQGMSPVYELKGHKKEVTAVRFSNDGSLLASAGADKMIFIWNTANGSIVSSGEIHSALISDIEFSPDGKLIASSGFDRMVKISRVSDLTTMHTLSGHSNWVQSVSYSSDGRLLLSGGHDHLIILWDAENGLRLATSDKQKQIVMSVSFRPQGTDFISSALLSEEIRNWALSGPSVQTTPVVTAGAQTDKTKTGGAEPDRIKTAGAQTDKTKTAGTGVKTDQTKITEAKGVTAADTAAFVTDHSQLIEFFSPITDRGRIDYFGTTLQVIGRIKDPAGTSSLVVNGKPVALSDLGVFEVSIDLIRGFNTISFMMLDRNGRMSSTQLLVNCLSEHAPEQLVSTPGIFRGKYYALLIAVNDYTSGEISNLDYPARDAEAFGRVLSEHYTFEKENIFLLKNPTQGDIIVSLEKLSEMITPEDNLLIFYAGHGYWDKKGRIGYWLPSDATRKNTVNWFRNSTLRDFIGSIESRHTLLIADACFSGAILKTRDAFPEVTGGIERLYDLPSRKAMTSGVLEEVPDESVFLRYLLKRLEENSDRFLSSEFLFSSFKPAVLNNSSTVPQFGVIQNVGDEGGDFIFIRRR